MKPVVKFLCIEFEANRYMVLDSQFKVTDFPLAAKTKVFTGLNQTQLLSKMMVAFKKNFYKYKFEFAYAEYHNDKISDNKIKANLMNSLFEQTQTKSNE